MVQVCMKHSRAVVVFGSHMPEVQAECPVCDELANLRQQLTEAINTRLCMECRFAPTNVKDGMSYCYEAKIGLMSTSRACAKFEPKEGE